MVWLLRRINDVLYNLANLGVPKHILIEEIFSSMKTAIARRRTGFDQDRAQEPGGVTMIGQSAEDLGANADSIVNPARLSSSSKSHLQPEAIRELFKMNEQQMRSSKLQDAKVSTCAATGTKVIKLNLDNRLRSLSTKPKDRVRRSRLIAKYGLTEGITRFVQASPNNPTPHRRKT